MNNLITKSFYSYVDLKKEVLKDLESGGREVEASIEMAAAGADGHLYQFFEEAEVVKEEMASIRNLLERLQAANEESKSTHKPEALLRLRDRINGDIVLVLKTARAIRGRLESMDRSNDANRRLSGCREGTPVERTRTAVTNSGAAPPEPTPSSWFCRGDGGAAPFFSQLRPSVVFPPDLAGIDFDGKIIRGRMKVPFACMQRKSFRGFSFRTSK